MSDLLQRVDVAVQKQRLFQPREAIMVAVSAGLDSMTLLHVLARLAPIHGWRLSVAHFNHQLRGRSSDADVRLVETAARKLKLPFVAGRADVRKFARVHQLSIEMAARQLRHKFFATAASKRKIRTIALAHHADDQVELFLLRLLRGAGADGLAGMKWRGPSPQQRNVFLTRPLLGEAKSALQTWATQEKIPFREDATNAQRDILRNRIRHELLPLLSKNYQPAVAPVILRQMEIIRGEGEFVAGAADKWLRTKNRGNFESLPVALQRRCLQVQLVSLGVSANFDLIEKLRETGSRPVMIGPNLSVFRDTDGRVLSRRPTGRRPLAKEAHLRFRGRAGEFAFAKRLISWQIQPLPAGIEGASKKRVNIEQFDADKVGAVISLRHWQPGDRFQPIGMEQPVKLQDLFVNQKIPRAERQELVVATTGEGEVFWVEGLRMAERFKLDKSTRRGLKWMWERL